MDDQVRIGSPFTVRVFAVGGLLCLLISVADPYATAYLQGSMMALDFSTEAALFLLFLVSGANILLKAMRPGLEFRREELAVIYAMMVTACSLPTMGLMLYLLPGVTALGYYTTPENGWQELIQPHVWHGDVRTFIMASCANSLKVAEGLGRVRPLFWALALAILVTLAGSAATILYLSYTYGGINLHGWFFDAGPQVPFSFIADKMQNLPQVQWDGWVFRLLGGVVMGMLMYLRHHFLWWPFNPLGFAICTVSYIVGRMWFSVFVAWLLKLTILKYGGPGLHRSIRPFFMGLILGQFCAEGLWLIIDLFTGSTGNYIGW